MMGDTTTEQIEALSRSVTALDGARRVGFGRAYSAQAKLDEALADLNIACGDRDMYRRALSWLHGYTRTMFDTPGRRRIAELLAQHLHADIDKALDDVSVHAGRRAASADVAGRRERAAVSQRLSRHAQSAVERRMAARYGFGSFREMRDWMDEHRGRRDDTPGADDLA